MYMRLNSFSSKYRLFAISPLSCLKKVEKQCLRVRSSGEERDVSTFSLAPGAKCPAGSCCSGDDTSWAAWAFSSQSLHVFNGFRGRRRRGKNRSNDSRAKNGLVHDNDDRHGGAYAVAVFSRARDRDVVWRRAALGKGTERLWMNGNGRRPAASGSCGDRVRGTCARDELPTRALRARRRGGAAGRRAVTLFGSREWHAAVADSSVRTRVHRCGNGPRVVITARSQCTFVHRRIPNDGW